MLKTDHWRYLHGNPESRGQLKVEAGDFVVKEILGYEPCGEGEHIYLWCRKTGLNTAFVAEQIAKFCQMPLRAVTYAGRKDKHAVTEQWFGVHKPGKDVFDWQRLQLEGLEILSARRHNKKLRTGVLKGNHFELYLRNISAPQKLEERLKLVKTSGVPNYYGQQRFGESRYHPGGSNLALAEKMIEGESIRNRNKRSMAISAMRSWLFNEYISQRIEAGKFNSVQIGDPVILSGSNSFFIAENDINLVQRLADKDIQLSAPLWGAGELLSKGDALTWETSVAESYPEMTQTLSSLGLKQERRAISLFAEDMRWNFCDDGVKIQFNLPSGCFATSVIRELINPVQGGEES